MPEPLATPNTLFAITLRAAVACPAFSSIIDSAMVSSADFSPPSAPSAISAGCPFERRTASASRRSVSAQEKCIGEAFATTLSFSNSSGCGSKNIGSSSCTSGTSSTSSQ